uniref:DEAD/SNF2-like helicase n=1 Tax=Pithovirus LCPAC102 TaxID=2506587 RepID=A0A481Z2S0_9VIRU|nr:MAG: DEAD/SNF2-like helicase [Pithovirus LCPAC102]
METRYGYDGTYTKGYDKHNIINTVNKEKNTTSSIIDIMKGGLSNLFFNNLNSQLKYEQIRLFECQVNCYTEMIKMFKIQYTVFNGSPTRSGKSITTLAVCSTLGLNPFVVGPGGIKGSWDEETSKYGFTDYMFIGYDTLSGKTDNLNHKYLVKHEKKYYPTEWLRMIIKAGVMVILDECHLVKNPNSSRSNAVHAIVKCVLDMKSSSRVLIMSATPYDKPEFSQSFIKSLGIITSDKMYEYDRHNGEYLFQGYGFGQLITMCDLIDKDNTTKILSKMKKINKTTVGNTCHELFINILLCKYVTYIVPDFPTKVIARNGYFNISSDAEKQILMFEQNLIKVTGFNQETNEVSDKIDFGAVIQVLHSIERIMLEVVIRITLNKLQSNPNNRVVVYLWYRDTTNHLAHQLSMYSPGIINGTTNAVTRTKLVRNFQDPNHSSRLLIGHAESGGQGLALDDQYGGRPLTILMMPDYRFITISQALARGLGMMSKSDCEAWIMFAKVQKAQRLLEILSNKEEIVRSLVGIDSQIVTPGNLSTWIEPNM